MEAMVFDINKAMICLVQKDKKQINIVDKIACLVHMEMWVKMAGWEEESSFSFCHQIQMAIPEKEQVVPKSKVKDSSFNSHRMGCKILR